MTVVGNRQAVKVGLFALLMAVLGCDSGGAEMDTSNPDPEPSTLGERAAQRGFYVGAAVNTSALASDSNYRRVLGDEFNMVTAENVMKMGLLQPVRGQYVWDDADALVDFAEANGMAVRGHALVWHQQMPSWLENGIWTRQELIAILQDHITTVVTRYRGRIAAWDVVNEGISDGGGRRPSIFQEVIGPEYMALAFQFAHAADPDAVLFYNDYSAEGTGAKSDAVFALAQDLLSTGTPLHGVGLQMHVTASGPPSIASVRSNIRRLGGLGLEVHITEMDVRIPIPASEASIIQQASVYDTTLRMCLEESACTALVFWGFTDRYSWVPSFFQGFGAALPFDEDYRPKLAHQVMLEALAG